MPDVSGAALARLLEGDLCSQKSKGCDGSPIVRHVGPDYIRVLSLHSQLFDRGHWRSQAIPVSATCSASHLHTRVLHDQCSRDSLYCCFRGQTAEHSRRYVCNAVPSSSTCGLSSTQELRVVSPPRAGVHVLPISDLVTGVLHAKRLGARSSCYAEPSPSRTAVGPRLPSFADRQGVLWEIELFF